MMFMAVLWLLLVAFLLRRLLGDGGRALPPGWAERTDGEVARLREEVERLGREVGRLEEEQSFLLRLMSAEERPGLPTGPEPARERGQGEEGEGAGLTVR